MSDNRQLAVAGEVGLGHVACRVVGAQPVVADQEDDRGIRLTGDALLFR
jgi:hypothetical protein